MRGASEAALWCCLHFWKEHQARAALVKLTSALKSDVPWLGQTSHTDQK